MPDFTHAELEKIFKDKAKNCPDTELESFMSGIINKKVGQIILKQAGIYPLSRKASSLSDKEITSTASLIKNWQFNIEGTMSWNNAQVTKGGIITDDFDKNTMQSKLINGVFAAGEILDIDGDCGGYNLHFAFASANTAFMHIVKDL